MKCAGAFVILIFSGFSVCAATWNSDGSVANIQSIHDTQAHDGDTITIPGGTFDWTLPLRITKGITLQGQTTITGAGTGSPTINDATIIKDDAPRNSQIVVFSLGANRSARMTGITFAPGATTQAGQTDGAIWFSSADVAPCNGVRLDHCHFRSLYQSHSIRFAGWIYGVADHNVVECRGGSISIFFTQEDWGGPSQGQNGEGSWADYPWYGTEKFMFIEDNTIVGSPSGPQTSANFDAWKGGRYVARHNYFEDTSPNAHGTEGGFPRGIRACEIYDNTFNWTYPQSSRLLRSGGMISHDNTWTGVESTDRAHTRFGIYRMIGAIGNDLKYFGIANGNNPWDVNDPHGLYASGTATAFTPPVSERGTVQDSSKNWTANQWAGYSVTNTTPKAACYNHASYIISNTANTLTYAYYNSGDRGSPLTFNAGDAYSIYKLLVALDQSGRGKGDLIVLDSTNHPHNSTCKCASWPHEALEPCFSWNNVYAPNGDSIGFAKAEPPTLVAGRDYYDLGTGFPADTIPGQVRNIYVASLNGSDYTAEYIYPHPLVTGWPMPPPAPTLTPTPTSTQHFQKKWKKQAKELKRKWKTKAGQNSEDKMAQPLASPPEMSGSSPENGGARSER